MQVMVWPMPVAEKWLRAYLDKSPNRQTRARACFELALYKKWLLERAVQEMDADWIEQPGEELRQRLDRLPEEAGSRPTD